MTEAHINSEIPRTVVQSGYAYVSALGPDGKPHRITVADELRCGHQNRICARCLGEWATDYQLLLSRTAAGRKLAAKAGRR